jgi:hypothetical protein
MVMSVYIVDFWVVTPGSMFHKKTNVSEEHATSIFMVKTEDRGMFLENDGIHQ